MIEAVEAASYEGKLLCAFPTRDECKNYVREKHKEIDPFDILIKTQYISDHKPTGYLDR